MRYWWASGSNPLVNLFVWVLSGVVLSLAAEFCCIAISPESKGSGIAEMKSILSGVILTKFLSLRALFAKFFGLIFAIGGGLSFGKEGPFVHLAAIVTHQLSSTVVFKSICQIPGMRRQLLSAAVGAGVTSTFGAPLGGALFSIEVTSTYFTVSSLWKTFWCTAITYLCFSAFHSLKLVHLFDYTALPRFYLSPMLIFFILLGILTGILSALFVYVAAAFMLFLRTRTRFSKYYMGNYKITVIITVISSILTFKVFKLQDHEIINAMFTEGPLPEPWNAFHWTISIIGYVLYKGIFTSFSLGLPIPAGIYTPIFATGALIGRFFGEVLKLLGSSMEPGVFAVAAAAGLTSACTRTLATGVIVFEVIGQLEHLLPVLITVIISYAMAKSMSVSVYDLSLRVKALPYVPLMRVEDFEKTAQDTMTPITRTSMLTNQSTISDLRSVLKGTNMFNIPLVKSLDDPIILGCITRSKLEYFLEKRKNFSDQDEHLTSDLEELKIMDDIEPSISSPSSAPISPLVYDDAGSRKDLEDERINYSEISPFIDEAPFCILPKTTLHKVHYLFTMLGLGQAFVVLEGRLLGTITLHELTSPNTHCTDYTFNVL